MALTHFSLFSGIGGIDLAAEWAGFTTVGQCEWADYPTKVLEKHWPDVPRWRDIRSVTAESFYERTGLRTVDLISGGFPCQPFSVAGKQKGKRDDRYLWPEMLRVIREIKPTWVLGENVPGILRIAGRTVCEDLERAGYAVTVLNFEAAAVGAPHRRDRVFFVGNTKNEQGPPSVIPSTCTEKQREFRGSSCESNILPNTDKQGLEGYNNGISASKQNETIRTNIGAENISYEYNRGDWWAAEPDVGRVAHGIPFRVDRLKCLGNAVVPQQVYPILAAIAELEIGGL
jgi:DNA (cytosine-5)-methyltransferase 1